MKTIGIAIDRQRTYGRRLCQGIVDYARTRTDWTLQLIEPSDLEKPANLAACDGFIARVLNDQIARRLAATGKPVVDVFCERPYPTFATADQNARLIGQMAARHFIEHHFTHFAFCGYNGFSYSDLRRDAFCHCLELNHFTCDVYRTPPSVLKMLGQLRLKGETLAQPKDHNLLANWLLRLKKPVALFCANDMRAYQVIAVCKEIGLNVPNDVAVLGVDDELVCEFIQPTLSSIDPNGRGVGSAAAETLARIFNNSKHLPASPKVGPLKLVERQSTNAFPLDPPWLSDALVFIRGNITGHLAASDVYRHLGKSHTLVDSAFRKALNSSVQQEIIRLRLAEARHLVTTTDLPLGQVASRSGFASPQYFCSAFTKAFGASPTAVRNGRRPLA